MTGSRRPGVNPQTSLVSETLFPTSRCDQAGSSRCSSGTTLFIIPRDKHICASLRALRARDQRAASRPVHFLDERISPAAFALYLTRN